MGRWEGGGNADVGKWTEKLEESAWGREQSAEGIAWKIEGEKVRRWGECGSRNADVGKWTEELEGWVALMLGKLLKFISFAFYPAPSTISLAPFTLHVIP